MPKKLADAPELYWAVEHVWRWFVQINNLRSGESVSVVDIEAWCRLTKTRLQDWELQAIFDLNFVMSSISHESFKQRMAEIRNKGQKGRNG